MFQIRAVEKIKTHILRSVTFYQNSCLLKNNVENTVERGTPQMTVWRMRISCWIPYATNTYSQYVILIAFPLQKWLHEHASMLRYTNITCLVKRKRLLIATARIYRIPTNCVLLNCTRSG